VDTEVWGTQMSIRRNEEPKTWFRCERFFRCNDQWYFHTREGISVGPYRTRLGAEVDAGLLMATLRDTPAEQAHRAIRDFLVHAGGDLDMVHDPELTSYLTEEERRALTHRAI
jgi:hypothetical protein